MGCCSRIQTRAHPPPSDCPCAPNLPPQPSASLPYPVGRPPPECSPTWSLRGGPGRANLPAPGGRAGRLRDPPRSPTGRAVPTEGTGSEKKGVPRTGLFFRPLLAREGAGEVQDRMPRVGEKPEVGAPSPRSPGEGWFPSPAGQQTGPPPPCPPTLSPTFLRSDAPWQQQEEKAELEQRGRLPGPRGERPPRAHHAPRRRQRSRQSEGIAGCGAAGPGRAASLP